MSSDPADSPFLFLDIETRSAIDLKKTGSHVYFESDTTDLWMACYAFGDEQVQTWWPSEPCPERIRAHVRGGGTISGWNVAGFEMLAWNALLWPKYGWPVPKLEQYDDTAAMAAAMALPRDLGGASQALGLEVQKDMEGRGLMLRMSKPRKPRKGEPDGLYWNDEPEKLKRLADYCRVDVETERAARRRLVPLSAAEREVWLLDARINNRGVRIDTALVRSMLRIVEQQQAKLDQEMTLATAGYVTATSQVAALTRWLQGRGVPAESLAKAALSELLDLEDVPDDCRRALEIRKEAAKSSTAKLKAALECVGRDERVRGLHLYHGASTGRWCLAENSMVLARSPVGEVREVPIQWLDPWDEVWDGDNWVEHDGVVFSGEKYVIEHDGVVATPEHKVYVSDSEYTPLGEARRLGTPLYQGKEPSCSPSTVRPRRPGNDTSA